MKQVSFTRMLDGTKEDYELIYSLAEESTKGLAERILAALEPLKTSFDGYKVTRYEHSLQAATRAYRHGESEEIVVAALLHDIGDELAPYNHSELAAVILQPYVSEKTYWIVKHHSTFQKYYYAHYMGSDRYEREKYRDHPYYQATVDFCENYDQNSFDPQYDTLPLAFFAPMVKRIFAHPYPKYQFIKT
ncbi:MULTISPECIES: HD domain-containing protein [unclassified Okeania]|uniref:HD domain-containing protein n=1 Tax=unclassified Okeania TaxID=2634635 RepID=UPI0013BB0A98|nr:MULTISPECIES: HD domain-containing protein [unclassified Okeania]NET16425.1 HD domain-containing protein [Okeania sp. SIO1H6]NES77550.1 HD domain-containing protein [Okeania sp. SIO1H4]NET18620.1 HD domain-containing protein [Okeania sp. SIO1H5]NET78654.1 HD domain-containing protein [Okeania sp. SIO1F9]NET92563.1 HD domain-containing protein [Okeania sp. SIO1H2]